MAQTSQNWKLSSLKQMRTPEQTGLQEVSKGKLSQKGEVDRNAVRKRSKNFPRDVFLSYRSADLHPRRPRTCDL